MARYTTLLDGRKSVKMTGRVYLRAIVPIGLFFSLSLICGNLTYLYLSVAFIQMIKVRIFSVTAGLGRQLVANIRNNRPPLLLLSFFPVGPWVLRPLTSSSS